MATSSVTFKQVKDNITKGNLAPIYLLLGEESYYIDVLTKEFEDKVIDNDAKDFNFNVIYGKEANANLLIPFLRQYPLMSDKRLVILKEAQMIDKREWEKMDVYFSQPQSSTCFVICYKNKTFPSVKMKNLLTKNGGVVFESKKLYEDKVGAWIASYIKEGGYTYDERIINVLVDKLGTDLQKIANEISKMQLNIKGTKHITLDDVYNYIGMSKDYNVFELQKHLARKDILKCNQIIDYFSKNPKENPIQMVISILFSFFAKTLVASQTQPCTSQAVAQALHTTPYMVRDYMTAINNYPMSKLFEIIALFDEYDLKTKGMDISPLSEDGELLKEFIFKILH